ncbi:cupin domain-containing protein [Candidatus Woesearchaeota archaeon]|nr:MAG: cupin domain-containing protein [Candidatus Woesearchaeota archaeon]
MQSISVREMINYSEGGIISKVVSKGVIEVTLFCMAAGTSIGEHTSTKKGCVYVIEGKGVFNLDGKDIVMEEGVIIEIARNAKHSLKAEKNTSFLLFLT